MEHVRRDRLSRHSPARATSGADGPPLTSPRAGTGRAHGHPAQRPGTGCCWPSRASASAVPNAWSPTWWRPATHRASTTRSPTSSTARTRSAPPSPRAARRCTRSGPSGNLDLRWMAGLPPPALVDGSFDIVHFHLPYTAALGRLVVATLPRRRRPVTVYTEHSLWNKVAVLVKVLNRATIGFDRALVAVSQAAYDALPRALRPRARVVVHGVDLSRSRSMVDRRRQVRRGGARRARDPAGRPAGGHRGQPPVGEGLRRPARRGRPVGRREGLPVRFAAAGQGVEAEALAARHRTAGAGRAVPVPRPSERHARADARPPTSSCSPPTRRACRSC